MVLTVMIGIAIRRTPQHKTFSPKKVIITLFIILIVYGILLFITGYRFSPLEAAKANGSLSESVTLLDETNRDWVDFYYFKDNNKNQYLTVIVDPKGFLYVSRTSTWLYNPTDEIKTMGSSSYMDKKGHQLTTLLVSSDSAEVAYIEAGPESNRTKLEIEKGETLLFEFDNLINHNDMNPIAYDQDGKALYYYGYPKNVSYMKTGDYKWHEVE